MNRKGLLSRPKLGDSCSADRRRHVELEENIAANGGTVSKRKGRYHVTTFHNKTIQQYKSQTSFMTLIHSIKQYNVHQQEKSDVYQYNFV